MQKRTDRHFGATLLLMASALLAVLLLMQASSQAACDVVGDGDCDGFADSLEVPNFPLCGSTYTGLAPDVKDLFVIVTPENAASALAVMDNPLEFLKGAQSPVQSHQIGATQAGCEVCANCNERSVSEFQKAARIRERLDTADTSGTDDSLGWTDAVGPANGPIPFGDAYVYTGRIASWVNQQCGRNCRTSDNAADGVENVTKRFIRHTIAHEGGHMLNLKQLPDSQIGNHYPAGTKGTRYTLDQYVFVKSGVFYMGTVFNPVDPNNAQVR